MQEKVSQFLESLLKVEMISVVNMSKRYSLLIVQTTVVGQTLMEELYF